jgi:hypothetical protein
MAKPNINPELKKGDRIKLISMGDETSLSFGDGGTVKSKVNVFGIPQYGVDWDNGSSLQLLSDTDHWMFEDDYDEKFSKKINENIHSDILSNSESFTEFNMRFLYNYLKKVRESSVVNMFESPPLLYLGSDRIAHEFKYKDVKHEEEFNEVLEMADEAQSEMIQGVMKVLEKEGKEPDLSNINRYLKRYSKDILMNYIYIMS